MTMRRIASTACIVAILSILSPAQVDASVGRSCKKAGTINQARGTRCVKRNGVLRWVQFYVAPGKPVFVEFSSATSSLSWGNPATWGNPVASSFVIQIRSTVALDWVTVLETPISNRSGTVSNLSSGIGYEFRVAAKNSFRIGEFTNSGLSYIGTVPPTTTRGGVSTTTTTVRPTTTTTTLGVSVSKIQATRSAASYLRYMSFSRSGLIRQLEFEGFSNEDATYGVDQQNADWYAQAAKTAASYLKTMSFSRSGLIRQLLFEGFSQAEAEYGVNSVGL